MGLTLRVEQHVVQRKPARRGCSFWTALAERSGDSAFLRRAWLESGVALHLPPQTITQHQRQLRMEKAAELLKSAEYDVIETALEVDYKRFSHFSAAFQGAFGCCPGLYPLTTPRQKPR